MRRVLDGRSKVDFPPPMWKVKRELFRVGRQIDDLILRTTGVSPSRVYLHRVIDPKVICTPGALTVQKRAALYMIYPAQGLLQSHVLALDYILDCGYVPIVVSNLPLDPQATALILNKSAALITRPNFGYDFGAYRDGLRFLPSLGADPDYLAILNDSTWFPAHPLHNWFQEAEEKGCDLVGSVFHNGIDPVPNWDFTTSAYRPDPGFRSFHYGSYSLLIRRNLLTSPVFHRFWQDYRATNNKPETILRGEIGLTRMVVDAGFSHAATLDTGDLDRVLAALPDPDLHDLATRTLLPTNKKLRALRPGLLAQTPPDRAALISFILNAVVKEGPAYALVDFDVRTRTGSFIKKSSVTLDQTSADQTLQVLDHLPDPQRQIFRAEADRMYQTKFGPKSPA